MVSDLNKNFGGSTDLVKKRHGSADLHTRIHPSPSRPRSIYQYSNMVPRLSGQTSIFGVVSFVSKSLMGIEGQRSLKNLQF